MSIELFLNFSAEESLNLHSRLLVYVAQAYADKKNKMSDEIESQGKEKFAHEQKMNT